MRRIFDAFEMAEGSVSYSFFCQKVAAAAALTKRQVTSRTWFGRRRSSEVIKLHVLANVPDLPEGGEEPDVTAALDLLATCDELSTRAEEHLTGRDRRQALEMTYDLVTDVLAAMDSAAERLNAARGVPLVASPADATPSRNASQGRWRISSTNEEGCGRGFALTALGRREKASRRRQGLLGPRGETRAQFTYSRDMIWAAVGIALFAWAMFGWFFRGFQERSTITASLLAGAIGAVASVLSRVKGDGLDLDYEVGQTMLRTLGAVRPVLGAVSGVLLYFGVHAGIIPLALPSDSSAQFSLFLVSAFIAGFNERWVQDMLAHAGKRLEPST